MTSASSAKESKRLCLEIGGGGIPSTPSCIQLDIRTFPGVHIIADARSLPIRLASIDGLVASHIIEHFSYSDGMRFLQGCFNCLRVGGTVQISCPDLSRILETYRLTGNLQHLIGGLDMIKSTLYGGQSHPYDFHLAGYDFSLLRSMLESVGFSHVISEASDQGKLPRQVKDARELYELRIQASKNGTRIGARTTQVETRRFTKQEYWKRELDARDRMINELQNEQKKLNEELNTELNQTRTELNQARTELLQTRTELLQTRTELLQTRTELLQTRTELNQTRTELLQTRTELLQTRTELLQTRTELLAIQDSFGYNAVRFFTARLDRLLPGNTGRGEFRKIVVASLRIARKQGMGSLMKQVLKKVRRREFRLIE